MGLTKPKQSSFDFTTSKISSDSIKALGIENASFADLSVTVDKANLTGETYPGFEEDVALLGFKIAANGSLGKYNLVDQAVDAFEDADGVDASASTGETRDSDGKYYSGANIGSYTVSAFTSTGASTWTCPANTTEAEVLIVAGGGGGGGEHYAGGGGAGGVVHDEDYAVTAGVEYDITVGAGGAANAANGSDSVWNVNAEGSGITMTAIGGGRGGYGGGGGNPNGQPGGSGGGNDNDSTQSGGGTSTQTSPTGAVGYGNDGGDDTGQAGGGGGGASTAGAQGTSTDKGGAGGSGKFFSIFTAYGTTSGNVASSGSDGGYFAGGGGGGAYNNADTGGAAGVGGGGKGQGSDGSGGNAALANTGGGGGGASKGTGSNNGTGGSGIVLIRHRAITYTNMTLVSNATTAQAAPTKGDIVMTYSNGTGTAVINTDITAEFSADNGSTWTAITLASQGTTGGHTILSAHDVTRTSTSGTSMRYRIKTLNQSEAKQTRVHAVSLGWS